MSSSPAPPPPGVAVLIPSVRDGSRLADGVQHMAALSASDGIPAEIVVVLDGADQDVCDVAAGLTVASSLLSWPERRGFAAALNAGVRATSAPLVLVLQDDARPVDGSLASLLDTAARHPAAGTVGPCVLAPDGTLRSAGAVVGGNGFTSSPWVGTPPPPSSIAGVGSVDYVSSSCLLFRRAAWEDVGGFDEELYPLVYVDADFCTALWCSGWQVLVDPGARVVHVGGGSTTSPFREFLYTRNRRRFVDKWGDFISGRAPCPGSADEIAGEVERAAAWLEQPPGRRSPPEGAPTQSAPVAEDHHRTRELQMLREYVVALEARLAAVAEVGLGARQ